MSGNRHITPPSAAELNFPSSNESKRSSNRHYRSSNDSPVSIETAATTPLTPSSRGEGPLLLPKIRQQDQCLDTSSFSSSKRHKIAIPTTTTGYAIGNHYHSITSGTLCRSETPPDYSILTPPSSAPFFNPGLQTSYLDDPFEGSGLPALQQSFRPSIPYARSRSGSPFRGHARSLSENNSDSIISRYAYPTYRRAPTCAAPASTSANYSTPVPLEALSTNFNRSHTEPQPLAPELSYDSYDYPPASTTLLNYLTSPNPVPSLVQRYAGPSRLKDTHFWWDIRNVRPWKDFDLDAVMDVPGFYNLLTNAFPEPAVPHPGAGHVNPESTSALQDIYTGSLIKKVNAALWVSMGPGQMRITEHKPRVGERPLPDYVSNYDADYGRTQYGHKRARVVGLVKSFEQWNSGKRNVNPASTIEYLRELAHLHRFMREHSTRYGFIITEIELICVRAGTERTPHFGYLELAPAIELKATGPQRLTAALGLWYLHMLAENRPLPNQVAWQLDVGPPTVLSRQKVLPKDQWIFKPEAKEKRDAKRNRGWVMPEDALSKKECAKPRRVSKASA